MSLINQVLRDLDSRHAGEQKGLPNEVRPLPALRPRRSRVPLIAVLAVAGVAFVAWSAWDVAVPASAPAPVTTNISEAVPPPPLLIAPPPLPVDEAAGSVAETSAPAAVEPVVAVASLRMATTLRPSSSASAVTPAAASGADAASTTVTVIPPGSVDKQVRTNAYERADAVYRKAVSEQRQGRTTEAIEHLRETLREAPAHGSARQLLLSLLVERQQWQEAEAVLREGLEVSPSHSPWAMALARIQVERGQTAAAWDTLQKYLSFGESNADYLGFAGVLLQRLQRPGEAVAYYQGALRIKPDARWWVGLGLALESVGRTDEAREAFRSAQASGGLTTEMAAVVERRLR